MGLPTVFFFFFFLNAWFDPSWNVSSYYSMFLITGMQGQRHHKLRDSCVILSFSRNRDVFSCGLECSALSLIRGVGQKTPSRAYLVGNMLFTNLFFGICFCCCRRTIIHGMLVRFPLHSPDRPVKPCGTGL